MKAYERREVNAYPYFKLATWDTRSFTWKAGKATAKTEDAARAMAGNPGRYRVERFEESASCGLEPFEV